MDPDPAPTAPRQPALGRDGGVPTNGVEERLRAEGVVMEFGALRALDGVDLELRRGEVLGLIGPNGSGKTTLLNVLSGFHVPNVGRVLMDGEDISRLRPEQRLRAGLSRSFQGARLFPALSVRENIEVACLSGRHSRAESERRTDELLRQFGVEEFADSAASALPAGTDRRVGVARSVATEPRFLLLDEPAAGLNEREGEGLVRIIRSLAADFDYGVVLIEHDMRVITGACTRVAVLDAGRTIAEGSAADVRVNPAVLAAYFGQGEIDAGDN